MKHVVKAGTSTASPSFPSANPPSDPGGSQPSTSRTPSPPESGTASSSISGTGSEIWMAKSIWPAPANSAGRKGSEQQRGNCRPKTPARKRHFPSRKAGIHRKARLKAHCGYGGYVAEPRETVKNDGIFHGLSSGSHKG